MQEPTAGRLSFNNALIMTAFTLVFTALMAGTYLFTHEAIEKNIAEEKLLLINAILPQALYDNALLEDVLALPPTPEIGLDDGGHVWRARRQGEPVALVIEAAAPDGYAGRIDLIVAVAQDGGLLGVRVTQHHETPGLGDYIDPKKDKNKERPWISQFTNRPADLPKETWRVRKDGGEIDSVSGATISARAVTEAVGRVLAYVAQHHERLFAKEPA
ncbi:MAG: electron transport complex subunit RsxG [Betaproteobacteria bacterium]|nr:electron transport complex subunit RsxG [Betaproteobacteria bacterium]